MESICGGDPHHHHHHRCCCCCQVMCTKCLVSRLDQVFSVIGNWPWTTHISDVFNSNNYNGYVARNCNFVSQLMDFLLMPPLIRNTLPADQQQQQQPRDLTSLWLYLIIIRHGNLSGLFAWPRNLSGVQMLSPKKNEHGRWTSSHSVSQFLYYYYSSTGQPPPNTTTTIHTTLRTVNLPTYWSLRWTNHLLTLLTSFVAAVAGAAPLPSSPIDSRVRCPSLASSLDDPTDTLGVPLRMGMQLGWV